MIPAATLGPAVQSLPAGTLLAGLLLLVFGGCDGDRGQEVYEQRLKACSVAEGNGLLDAAVENCGAALAIADGNGYAADVVAGLLYRVGRLERQRGNFATAELLLRRSLDLAEAAGDPVAVPVRQVELAQILAGQDRWQDGLRLLERAALRLPALGAEERQAAAHVFGGFGVRLALLGHASEAEWCKAVAAELATLSVPK